MPLNFHPTTFELSSDIDIPCLCIRVFVRTFGSSQQPTCITPCTIISAPFSHSHQDLLSTEKKSQKPKTKTKYLPNSRNSEDIGLLRRHCHRHRVTLINGNEFQFFPTLQPSSYTYGSSTNALLGEQKRI